GAVAYVHGSHTTDVFPDGIFNYHWVDDHFNVAADVDRLSERRYCGTQRCLSAAVVARDSSCELVRPMSLLYHKRCSP
ncbi:hypothetical protein PF005_g28223, partial [Phytophthora fragariae]